MNWKRFLLWGGLALVIAFVGIQLIPYGHQHDNPPVTSEVDWGDAAVRQVAVDACYDCHSNETVWPWYSNIAPVSWLVQRDVDEGRRKLNFSDWPPRRLEREELSEVLYEGEMPPAYYTMLHPDSQLTETEKQLLARGLQQLAGR